MYGKILFYYFIIAKVPSRNPLDKPVFHLDNFSILQLNFLLLVLVFLLFYFSFLSFLLSFFNHVNAMITDLRFAECVGVDGIESFLSGYVLEKNFLRSNFTIVPHSKLINITEFLLYWIIHFKKISVTVSEKVHLILQTTSVLETLARLLYILNLPLKPVFSKKFFQGFTEFLKKWK